MNQIGQTISKFAITLMVMALILPTNAFAQTNSGELSGGGGTTNIPVNKNVVNPATPNTGTIGGSGYTPATYKAPVVTRTDGIEKNGRSGSSQQGSGEIASMISAVMMAGIAASTCPNCGQKGTCGTCAAATMGAIASIAAGQQMSEAQGESNYQVADVTPASQTDATSELKFSDTPQYADAVKKLDAAAKSQGGSYNKKTNTVKLPDGTALTAKGAQGGSGGGAPSMSSAEQAAFKAQEKKIAEAINAKLGQDGILDGGGDYGGGGGARVAVNAYPEASSARGAAAVADSRNPASVEGTFKDYNGTPIGVAQDSMFEMMHRRYRKIGSDENALMPAQ